MVVPVRVAGNGKFVNTYALLDTGSQRNIISQDIGNELGLDGDIFDMRVTTLENVSEEERKVADVVLKGLNGYSTEMKDVVYSRIQTSGDEDIPTSKDVEDLDYCRNVYFEAFRPDEAVEKHIGVVVGSGYG